MGKKGSPMVDRVALEDALADMEKLEQKVLKSVVVELGNGQKIPAHYGPHPPKDAPPTDYFWSLHWEIPADFPTGSLGYKVIATMKDDTTQTWEPFTRAPSQLAVVAGDPEMKK